MMKNPSVIVAPSDRVPKKASRLDLMVLELAAAGKVFRRPPRVFGILEYLLKVEVSGEASRGLHYPPGCAWAPWRALVPSGPHGLPPMCSFGSLGVFCPEKKSSKSFVAFVLRLVLIFCEVKKQAENIKWHWALCR
jgi:hypothetical protein